MAWRGEEWDWQTKQRRRQPLDMRKQFEDMGLDTSVDDYDHSYRHEVRRPRTRYQSHEEDSDVWGYGQGRTGGRGRWWFSSGEERESTNWRAPRQGSWRTQPSHESSMSIGPFDLVNYLARFQTFSASFVRLYQEEEEEEEFLEPSVVRQVASRYPDVFVLNGQDVELRPKLSLCAAHRSAQGCRNASCREFHICDKYVLSVCLDGFQCGLGHKWRTSHNIPIIKDLFLQHLEVPLLRKLVQLVLRDATRGQLNVCRAYNEGGCSQVTSCDGLHVCLGFVLGLAKCCRQDCELNHKLQSPECSYLLIAHGFSANDAPRDIALALLGANPAIGRQSQGPVAPRADSISNPGRQKPPSRETKKEGARNDKDGGATGERQQEEGGREASATKMVTGRPDQPSIPGSNVVQRKMNSGKN